MSRNQKVVLVLIASGFFSPVVPGARADSDSPTTISSEGDALSRSRSAVSLSPPMPSGPPALSTAGAPDVRSAVSAGVPPEASAAIAVGGGSEIAPEGAAPPAARIEAARVVAAPAAKLSAAATRTDAPRRWKAWRVLLGVSAGVLVLGLALR